MSVKPPPFPTGLRRSSSSSLSGNGGSSTSIITADDDLHVFPLVNFSSELSIVDLVDHIRSCGYEVLPVEYYVFRSRVLSNPLMNDHERAAMEVLLPEQGGLVFRSLHVSDSKTRALLASVKGGSGSTKGVVPPTGRAYFQNMLAYLQKIKRLAPPADTECVV